MWNSLFSLLRSTKPLLAKLLPLLLDSLLLGWRSRTENKVLKQKLADLQSDIDSKLPT